VTYADGTVHFDDTPLVGGGPTAEATAAADLRAVQIEFTAQFGQPLIGGEWFGIEHPVKGWRAYKVQKIDGNTLHFRPPLREAVTIGTVLDFANPRCLMVQDGRASSALMGRRQTTAAIRFVEAT
jgi:hypothetical protein